MYAASHGTFVGHPQEVDAVDNLRRWSKRHFRKDLESRPSLHRYVCTLPKQARDWIDVLRSSPAVRRKICAQFQQCDITPIEDTDEFYISHYNKDGGGDQGLFDKHYDGNLRFVRNATVVRALIYIESDGAYEVVFDTSGTQKRFKTYDFGILDFHREYHWVNGKYDPSSGNRILLKLNYLVCPRCTSVYENAILWANKAVFFAVKRCMEYSKSPKNPWQYLVGKLCNVMRVLNNIHVALPFLFIVAIAYGLLRLLA
jgi:hypothetical protein